MGILGNQLRARQIRTRFAARGIFAVAESALCAEPRLAFTDREIRDLPDRSELVGPRSPGVDAS